MLRGNIVAAAAVLGLCVIIGSVVLLVGAGLLLNRALDRVATIAQQHGQSIQTAGTDAGVTIQNGVRDLVRSVELVAGRLEYGGQEIRAGFQDLAIPVVDHAAAIRYAGDRINAGLLDLREGVDSHSGAIRDAGTLVGDPISQALLALPPAVQSHGQFLGETGIGIAQRPLELRMIEPLRIDGPLPVIGTNADGELQVDVDM